MGEVYRARDPRLGREVAIKVLPASSREDADRLTRFEQEARSASALNHPNIVTIYDIGSSDADSYIAMELVEGHEPARAARLRRRCRRSKLLDIAAQIAEGLAKAHARGDRPPGPEARERHGLEGRLREDPRLRPREAVRRADGAGVRRADGDRRRRRSRAP